MNFIQIRRIKIWEPLQQTLVLMLVGLAIMLAGCTSAPQRSIVAAPSAFGSSPWATPSATMRWNEYACDLITSNKSGQQGSVRVLAYLNLAIHNAIVVAAQQGRKSDGAAAGAAAAVLAYYFPNDATAIAARLSGETAALGSGPTRDDFAAGAQIGQTVAADVVAAAKSDRFDLAWTGTVPTGAGKWASSGQPARPPLFPRLGEMRPFFLSSASELRPPPPPALDSSEFKVALAELRSISDHRSTDQLRIAQYWENLTPPYVGGTWNDVARGAISAHGLMDAEASRVLALMHMAQIDAFIACHDAKYAYWLARPTTVDPGIKLAIVLPNHPSYPANHGCVSTASGVVLDAMFPDQGGRYTAMSRQAAESRVYGGIHYRFDIDAGMEIGRKSAALALANLPKDRVYLPVMR
jgi:hypothetical protein